MTGATLVHPARFAAFYWFPFFSRITVQLWRHALRSTEIVAFGALSPPKALLESPMPHLSRLAAAFAFSSLILAAAPGRAADVTLDSATAATGDKGKITFKTIVLTDCSLT